MSLVASSTLGRRALTVVAAAAIAAAALSLSSCRPTDREPSSPPSERSVERLAPAQVREYRGKNLSSIEDFRENSIKGPQKVDLAKYRLKVFGTGIEKPESLKYEQVTALPSFEKPVTLLCVEGWSVDILWEGVRLTDVFEAAGYDATATPPAAEPKVVIFRCVDGYSTSLPYDYVRDRDILLAYKMNGVELPEERGFPLQVVAEDKWGYKWAKWITSIELSRDTSFRGYWEKRGYGNEAAVPGK